MRREEIGRKIDLNRVKLDFYLECFFPISYGSEKVENILYRQIIHDLLEITYLVYLSNLLRFRKKHVT